MGKNVKTANIKQIGGKVNFTPVGTLVPYKLPKYKYFTKFSSTGDFKETGKTIFDYYSEFSLQDIKNSIPTVDSYVFVNINNGDSYTNFATLYVNGKLREVIDAIKTYVRVELPKEVQDIVNTIDISAKEQKKLDLTQKLFSQSFYQRIIDSIITGSSTLKEQVLLYVLNPKAILTMQYDYMIAFNKLDGNSAMQMKEGVYIARNESIDIIDRNNRRDKCIDAINQKANTLIASNKQLLQVTYLLNQNGTDVISYINQNLYALYDILKLSPYQSSANLRQQGYNLGLALNPLTKDAGLGTNKNNKTKSDVDFKTILLLAIPIVAIVLLKKKGK